MPCARAPGRRRRRCRSCWPCRRWRRCGRRRRRPASISPSLITWAAMLSQMSVTSMPSLQQLPRRQPRALEKRARLVGEDGDALALLHRGADDAERRAVARRGQRTGVAVREHAPAVRHDLGAETAHGPAAGDVFVVNQARLALEPARDLLGRLPRLRRLARTPASCDRSPRSRLTAVGRVAAIMSHVFWNSTANCLVPLAVLRCMPRAMPMAAETPMAGAPRMIMVRIARATSCAVRHRT